MTKPNKNYFRLATDENLQFLICYKKSLRLQKLADETIRKYSKDVYNLMLFLQERDIKALDITLEIFEEYLETLECGNARKLRIFRSCKKFYDFQRTRRRVKRNPIEEFDTSKLREE